MDFVSSTCRQPLYHTNPQTQHAWRSNDHKANTRDVPGFAALRDRAMRSANTVWKPCFLQIFLNAPYDDHVPSMTPGERSNSRASIIEQGCEAYVVGWAQRAFADSVAQAAQQLLPEQDHGSPMTVDNKTDDDEEEDQLGSSPVDGPVRIGPPCRGGPPGGGGVAHRGGPAGVPARTDPRSTRSTISSLAQTSTADFCTQHRKCAW